MKIVFNIKFIALTSNIKKISENIKSDVITSKVVSTSDTNNLQITNHMPCWVYSRFFINFNTVLQKS